MPRIVGAVNRELLPFIIRKHISGGTPESITDGVGDRVRKITKVAVIPYADQPHLYGFGELTIRVGDTPRVWLDVSELMNLYLREGPFILPQTLVIPVRQSAYIGIDVFANGMGGYTLGGGLNKDFDVTLWGVDEHNYGY